MAGEPVDFKRISQIYREESRRKTLTRLEPDFYPRLAAYVDELEERSAEATKEKFNSTKAALLRDELRKVQRKRDQIYSFRERKIALLALAKVGGGPTDTSVLTKEETALYESLVRLLSEGRGTALGAEADTPPPVEAEVEEKAPEPEPDEPAEASEDEAFVTVRLLEDVPSFAGLEGTYTLKRSDVVSLPKNVAAVLVGKGAAAEIKGTGGSGALSRMS